MYRKYKALHSQKPAVGCGASKQRDTEHDADKGADLAGNSKVPVSTTAVPSLESPSTDTASRSDASTTNNGTAVTNPGKATTNNGTAVTNNGTVSAPNKQKAQQQKNAMQAQLDDLMRMANETEALIRKALVDAEALRGNINTTYPSPSKIVRIFTSSTFTDTKQERNMLMKYGYPKIKEHCRKLGYEFQVVDMRWGVRDEATDDHMGTELCLKELQLCQQISTGPNFVSLLSHKYGYTAFPRLIEAEEFEKIFNNINDEDIKKLFQKWYTRDDNIVPPNYTLASISTHIPDFICNDPDKKKVAKNQWWDECQRMQDALEDTAKVVFDEETARKYIMSVTETEVQEGLLKVDRVKSNNSLWLKRNIKDIENLQSNYAVSRFIECLGPEEKVQKARKMLKELKEDKMMRKLDPRKILNYDVHWNPNGGIDPDTSEEHRVYLDKLCDDFVQQMKQMIDKSVNEKKIKAPLVEECLQHIRFAQTKCEGFAGRQDVFDKIKDYLASDKAGKPLVIYGSSGTGKTSVMAMAASMTSSWMKPKSPVVVFRFIGTSQDSSDLMSLLYSINAQISKNYKLTPVDRNQTIQAQILRFKASLLRAYGDVPLVIILDSLDQLDPAYDARKLAWLNMILPPNVKLIVSTLPEPQYECFPALKLFHKEEDKYVNVPVLKNEDVQTILNKWLKGRKRTLTDFQMNTVLEAFQKCPTPLFLKLSFEESTTWASYLPPERSILQDTVRASIDHLFYKLEKLHGKILVSRSMTYLTLAYNGATEAEIEDILSCDDDVLNDVYMYWTPPIRRLPPLLLVRIRTDLDQYLVERGVDDVRVLYWYHRQFTEAALARYCSDAEENRLRHAHLADFFNGTWAEGRKKPYTDAKGVQHEEDRLMSGQPLKFENNTYNLRALNNLPYHRIHADQGDLLQQQCLANVNFLLCKLKALPLFSVLNDFPLARAVFRNNPLIGRIHDVLLLSQKGLVTDSDQFIPQMLGRLAEDEVTKEFRIQCRNYGLMYIEPSKPILEKPGGQLVHCISAHMSDVDMMDMSTDGRHLVTACQESKEGHIWDVQTACMKRAMANTGQIDLALFCMNDNWIVYIHNEMKKVLLEEVETGIRRLTIPLPKAMEQPAMCVAGKNKSLLLLFKKRFTVVFDLNESNAKPKMLAHPEKVEFGPMSIPYGSENFVAVCTEDQYFITVLDLQTMTFKKKFRGFEVYLDDDGDETENEVEAMAIEPTETHLAYTTMFTSEIVFADFDGNRLRRIPANEDRSFQSLNFSPDGQFLFLHDGNQLIFFNTNTLEEVDSLEHSKSIISAKTRDMKTIVTLADDSNLRIWDRTRPKKQEVEDKSTSELASLGKCREVFVLKDTKYVVIRFDDTAGNTVNTIGVYDIFKEKLVRLRTFENCGKLIPMDTTRVITIVERRKAYVIKLDTMEYVALQGTLSSNDTSIVFAEPDRLVCVSKGSKNLKVYDASTGNVLYILKAGQKQNIDSFIVNKTGTLACAVTDEGPLLVFDMKRRQHLYNIENAVYGEYFGFYKWINDAGTRLVFETEKALPKMGTNMKGVGHAVMWDVQCQKEMFRMHDALYCSNYAKSKSTESTAVESVDSLDDNRLIMGSYDNILRIYDTNTGELLNRLEGHTTTVDLHLDASSPYILSYGKSDEEDCLRLWDKHSCKQVASYSLDKSLSPISWMHGGEYFVTISKYAQKEVINWRICHGLTTDANFSDLFQPIPDTDEPIKLNGPKLDGKMVVADPDDPDSDPEIFSDTDDDDDDDGADKL